MDIYFFVIGLILSILGLAVIIPTITCPVEVKNKKTMFIVAAIVAITGLIMLIIGFCSLINSLR